MTDRTEPTIPSEFGFGDRVAATREDGLDLDCVVVGWSDNGARVRVAVVKPDRHVDMLCAPFALRLVAKATYTPVQPPDDPVVVELREAWRKTFGYDLGDEAPWDKPQHHRLQAAVRGVLARLAELDTPAPRQEQP